MRVKRCHVMRVSTCLLMASLVCAAVAFAGGVAMVSQKGRAFTAASVQIARGDIVRFTNEDSFLHQIYVHAPELNFESDEQAPGTSVDIRFPTSGSFEVRCQIHPKMLLNVSVH